MLCGLKRGTPNLGMTPANPKIAPSMLGMSSLNPQTPPKTTWGCGESQDPEPEWGRPPFCHSLGLRPQASCSSGLDSRVIDLGCWKHLLGSPQPSLEPPLPWLPNALAQ